MPKAIRGFERKNDVEIPLIPARVGNERGISTCNSDGAGDHFLTEMIRSKP